MHKIISSWCSVYLLTQHCSFKALSPKSEILRFPAASRSKFSGCKSKKTWDYMLKRPKPSKKDLFIYSGCKVPDEQRCTQKPSDPCEIHPSYGSSLLRLLTAGSIF